LVVDRVGTIAAQVEGDAGAADHGAGEGVLDAEVLAGDADVGGALDEDVVEAEQVVVLVDLGLEVIEELGELFEEQRGQVPRDAADVDVGEGQACAAELLEEVEDVFALAEGVEEGGEGAHVQAVGAEADEVGGDAVEFDGDDADVFSAKRD